MSFFGAAASNLPSSVELLPLLRRASSCCSCCCVAREPCMMPAAPVDLGAERPAATASAVEPTPATMQAAQRAFLIYVVLAEELRFALALVPLVELLPGLDGLRPVVLGRPLRRRLATALRGKPVYYVLLLGRELLAARRDWRPLARQRGRGAAGGCVHASAAATAAATMRRACSSSRCGNDDAGEFQSQVSTLVTT